MVANHFDTLSFIAEKISSHFLKEVVTFLASKGDKKKGMISIREKRAFRSIHACNLIGLSKYLDLLLKVAFSNSIKTMIEFAY